MKTIRIAAIMAAALTIGGTAAQTAQAQAWGGYNQGYGGQGYGGGYGRGYYGGDGDRQGGRMAFICSGQRAHGLEARLRHEVDEGDIDPRQAGRIHDAIDDLEGRQRNECGEGDWRSVNRIAMRYDRIEGWINASAHQGGGWGGRGW
ncbi:hypothetical protein IP65_08815 [Novosphingobium sp. AAP1]|uniref:hypothetical protein n=1 Tax=unclassified Novosphingobium TaxID=2644732 RepID=UPI0003B51BF3|nr:MULTISPECIES: hypothetical protein [unclassified Novosphingobium]KPF54766.1 hypothetical protein IP65_08815 [Novosphingobium sp. AAP1]